MPDQKRKICLLSQGEARRYRDGIEPVCRNHRHFSFAEIIEMIRPERSLTKANAQKVADWIDSRHAVAIQVQEWKVAWTADGYRQFQLLRQGERMRRSPFMSVNMQEKRLARSN